MGLRYPHRVSETLRKRCFTLNFVRFFRINIVINFNKQQITSTYFFTSMFCILVHYIQLYNISVIDLAIAFFMVKMYYIAIG